MGAMRGRRDAIQEIFGKSKIAIGVVHCQALPGSPRHARRPFESIVDQALADAAAYVESGLDGLIVENHGDIPFLRERDIGPETAAALGVITARLRSEFSVPLGVNVLANAAMHALAVAKAGGASFVRVNQWANAYIANEGLVEGEAGKVLRYRAAIAAEDVRIFADVHVKHGAHAIVADRPLEELARDAEFFDADVAIATGQRTGNPTSLDEVRTIASATTLPVVIGSGVSEANVESLLTVADGVIIGSSLKIGRVWSQPVAPVHARRFAEIMASIRERVAAK
jgi:membrane complex biogenesis BtpA family protein